MVSVSKPVKDHCLLFPHHFFRSERVSWVGDMARSIHLGPVAQWITRLTTNQKIPGSTPGWLEHPFNQFWIWAMRERCLSSS